MAPADRMGEMTETTTTGVVVGESSRSSPSDTETERDIFVGGSELACRGEFKISPKAMEANRIVTGRGKEASPALGRPGLKGPLWKAAPPRGTGIRRSTANTYCRTG